MTQHRLIFHPGTEADIADIVGFYAQRDRALPAKFRARLSEEIDGVLLFPHAGMMLFEEYRRVQLRRFPFMVVYLVSDHTIYVLAIVHVRRDPAGIRADVAGRAAE